MDKPSPLVTHRDAGLIPKLSGKAQSVFCGDGQYRRLDQINGVTGTSGAGSAGQVAYWTSAHVIDGDSSFLWDPTDQFLKVTGTVGKQLELAYNGSNTVEFLTDSTGDLYIRPTGASVYITEASGGELFLDGDDASAVCSLFFSEAEVIKWSVYKDTAANFRIDSASDTILRIYQASGNVGLGSASDQFLWDQTNEFLRLTGDTGKQLQLRYDNSNTADLTVNSGGDLTIAPSGLDTNITGRLSVSTLTATRIPYAGASGLLSDSASLIWDNANAKLKIFGTTGAQLQFGDSSNMSVSHRFYDDGGAYDSTYIIDPASAITHDGAFCVWKMYASDFSFSYGSGTINGSGVPNVTISGPPNTGTYTAASGPGFNLNNELETADNKLWSMALASKHLIFRTINDANNSALTWLDITRSGTNVSSIGFASDSYVFSRASDTSKNMSLTVDAGGDVTFAPSGGDSTFTGTLTASTSITATTSILATTFLRVGSATDAAASGDLSAGATGAARLFYDQSTQLLQFNNASGGTQHVLIGAFPGADSFGCMWFGTGTSNTAWSFAGEGSNTYVNAPSSGAILFRIANADAWKVDANKTLFPSASLATNMTTGFLNIPGAAGAPSGTPATTTGFPVYWDSTNKKLYVYSGGAWMKGQVGGVDVVYA